VRIASIAPTGKTSPAASTTAVTHVRLPQSNLRVQRPQLGQHQSTDRYRLASVGRRVSLRTTSGSRLPAARSDACTATASTCSRVLMAAPTKTNFPSVHAGSPGSPDVTCKARLEIAEASKLSRAGLSAIRRRCLTACPSTVWMMPSCWPSSCRTPRRHAARRASHAR
jgi:hypothetical protein